MVARVVPQSARRRHAESRKPDLWGCAAGGRRPVLLDDVVLEVLEDLLAFVSRVVEEQREELLLGVKHFAHVGDVLIGCHLLHAARFGFASCESFRLVVGLLQNGNDLVVVCRARLEEHEALLA